ncbi:MAG TPA: glycoside hydrolase family 130 protein [Gemmatimonadales bacterium]|nr:glycoside hydrolase family 130 protein [Gemmatimonadales bacterium]
MRFAAACGAVLLLALMPQASRQSWMIGPFVKPAANPIITADATSRFRSPISDSVVAWEAFATFNPAAVVRDGKVYLLYRAEDATGRQEIGGHTSRLGLAESSDGVRFTRRPAPVLYPDTDAQRGNEWPGGVEDPRIVQMDDSTYVLTYTQWNRDVPRLAVATSRDLIHWTKHGPAFARAAEGKYLRTESKSGAILSRIEGDRLVATRVNGKYWMYFGVPDLKIATSDNLLDWTPLEDSTGQALKILSPRQGYFDSWLVEGGPPALITKHGIVVLYNAGNTETHTYAGGQALFDARNPVRLIARSDTAFIKPTENYERTGQYTAGTTFVEGLVPFHGRWYLYYGTADSRVGVAISTPRE